VLCHICDQLRLSVPGDIGILGPSVALSAARSNRTRHVTSAIEYGKRTSDVGAGPPNSILADLSTGLSVPPS
jgi:hypothetical protein